MRLAMASAMQDAPVTGTNPADLPLIDIAPFVDPQGDEDTRRQVARRFGAAFESHGFAAIVNHGVDGSLVQGMYAAAQGFFALPLPAKLACTAPERAKGRGYLPVGIESVATTLGGETPADLVRGTGVRRHPPGARPDPACRTSGRPSRPVCASESTRTSTPCARCACA